MKIYSEDAYHLLHRLGATANYTGFSYLVRALQLCAEEPERLLLVTKWLYPDVAKQYGTNWKAVELLEDLARRELSQKPCTAQLLAILHASLLPSGSSTDEE